LGWVEHIDRGGSAWVSGLAPRRCPGCGALYPFHPWRCPVLVRLSAQLLAGCPQPVEGWRDRAVALANAAGDPHSPEAGHWRAVAGVGEPDAVTTPDLVPVHDGAGLEERFPGTAECNLPTAFRLLELIECGPLGKALSTVSPGWVPRPFAFLVPGDPVALLPHTPAAPGPEYGRHVEDDDWASVHLPDHFH
jgi:hypothetical protein